MTSPELFDFNTTVIFSSVFAILGMSSLLLYFVLNHKVFIHFCILVFGLAAHISLPLLGDENNELLSNISVVTALVTTIGALLFARSFIGFDKEKYPGWFKIFHLSSFVAYFFCTIQVLNLMFWNSEEFSQLVAYVAAFLAFFAIVLSLVVSFSLWKKEKLAPLFMYINLPMLLASIAYIILWFTQLDGEFEIRPYLKLLIYGGMTTQMVLFSVFVGYKIKNAEKEKLLLERSVNRRLQEEVDRQTHSLKETMAEVENQKNELQSLNDLKNKLFTLVAHDLRNPLQNLSSLIELLEKNVLDPERMTEFTHRTKVGLSESLMIMERLLHWSYKQLDGIHVQKENIDLKVVVSEVKDELKSLAQNKKIQIKTDLNDKIIFFDRDMLRVILRNLISNGIKFSYEQGLIEISTTSTDEEISVHVRDYGVGMNPVWYENLVKTGNPEVKSGTKGEKGNGFGLLITKDFVEMNGGTLICESELEKGTTFTLNLPKS